MNRYIPEEFHSDPALRRRLFADARRDRARAVHAAWTWLVKHLTPRSTLRPGRWIERLG